MSFNSLNQLTHKLRTLFTDAQGNRPVGLQLFQQEIISAFKQTLASSITIFDSDWVGIAVDTHIIKTIKKGQELPTSLSVDFEKELDIPDLFLPYIEPEVIIEPHPNGELSTYEFFEVENWDGDYIEVKGDGEIIYRGPFPLTSNNLVSQSQIDDGDVPVENVKKVYNILVFYTDGISGDDFVVSGEVIAVRVLFNPQSCDSTDITDTFFTQFLSPTNKVTDLTVTQITATGALTEREFVTGSPSCDIGVTVTDPHTATYVFAAQDSYRFTVSGVRTNISQGGTTTGEFLVLGNEITDNTITFQGYRPYYSSLTQKELTILNTPDITLTNFPSTFDGDTLPYTTITVNRNPGSFPFTTAITSDLFVQAIDGNFVNGNAIRKDFTIFKIAENKYLLKLKFGATIIFPANTEDPNPSVTTQDDTYTISGATYTQTGDVTGAKSNGTYVVGDNDIRYRIIINLKNPLKFQEVRKYGSE